MAAACNWNFTFLSAVWFITLHVVSLVLYAVCVAAYYGIKSSRLFLATYLITERSTIGSGQWVEDLRVGSDQGSEV